MYMMLCTNNYALQRLCYSTSGVTSCVHTSHMHIVTHKPHKGVAHAKVYRFYLAVMALQILNSYYGCKYG